MIFINFKHKNSLADDSNCYFYKALSAFFTLSKIDEAGGEFSCFERKKNIFCPRIGAKKREKERLIIEFLKNFAGVFPRANWNLFKVAD